MFLNKGLSLTFIVIGCLTIIQLCHLVAGGKDKGQSIIMDGDNLIMKDNDKKKKGDTIVIRSSSGGCGCGCPKKSMPVPYPVVFPQKEVKYVHVPVHHGGSGWLGGHEMMQHGFARSDEIFSEPIERPTVGIGEKIDSIDYDFPSDGEPRPLEPIPPMIPEELGDLVQQPYFV